MNLWQTLLLNAGVVLAIMVSAWAVGRRRGRDDGVDVVWGAGFAVVALVTLVVADGPLWLRLLVTAMTVAWGARLAWHIERRNHGKPEDRRYVAMRERGTSMFVRVYVVQGTIMWIVSTPVQVAQFGDVTGDGAGPSGPGVAVLVAGVLVWAVGLVFETVGDAQLAAFTRDPANKGTVMDRGLWRYTRHPNYFGDACVWWGLFLVACSSSWAGALTVVSPVLMTFLLTRVSGAALLEKTMSSRRPGYAEYVARTSGFFPLPPRKGPVAGAPERT